MKRFATTSLAVSFAMGLSLLLGLVEGCGRSSLFDQTPFDGFDASMDGTSDGSKDGSEDGPDTSTRCKSNKDCSSTPSTPYCEVPPGRCVACEVPSQCPTGDTCRDFKCVPLCTDGTCAGGLTCCSDVCVNEQTDPDNCDGCGQVCPDGEACTMGECQIPKTCNGGPPCGPEDQCCSSGCADTNSDPKNCGGCARPCLAGQTCVAGTCTTPTSCNGGPVCPPADECCPSGCTDTSSDPKNCATCGHACPMGESCVESKCQGGPSCNGEPACTGGETCCMDGCTNTNTDPNNCKTCGNLCGTGQTCVKGTCTSGPACNGGPSCTMGETCCMTGCTDTSSDPNNCGKCGRACGPDSTCAEGSCQSAMTCNGGPPCPTSEQCCASGCIDTTSDPNNCKNCGTVCPLGDKCIDSVCTPSTECNSGPACTTGLSCCPSPTGCVNESSDPNNCGGCGVPCALPNTCTDGVCVVNEGGLTPMENPCVLTPGVHSYTSIDIPVGVTCYVEGGGAASGTLQLNATGPIVIAGAIDLSGGYGRQDEISSETTETGWGGNGGYTGCPEDLDPVGPPDVACGFSSGTVGIWGFAATGTAGGCSIFTGCDFATEMGGCSGTPGICPETFTAPLAQYGGGAGIFTGYRAYGGGGGGPAGGAPGALGAAYPGEQDCTGVAGSGGATAGQGALGGGAPYDGQAGVTGQTQCAGLAAGVPPAFVGGGGGGSIGPFASADLAAATTFQTGSGGGGGSADYLNRPEFGGTSGGGGGGGALRLSSTTSISITGQVLANGGPGGDAYIGTGMVTGCNPQPGAAGGGGSGGLIYLSAPSITVASGATVSAVGGVGGAQSEFATGGGGGQGGLGRIRLSVSPASCTLSGSFNPPLASGCSASSKTGTTYVAVYPN